MPKMEDLDSTRFLLDAVVNDDRSMNELADTAMARNGTANKWKALQQVHVVE